MHRTSLAPVLSATLSRDSCWIISVSPCRPGSHGVSLGERVVRGPLLGALEDLDDPPALGRRQRAGLHDQHPVADAALVLLVVGLQLGRTPHDLAVERVLDAVLDGDDDGLVHLVADDDTLAGLAGPALDAAADLDLVVARGLAHLAPPSSSAPGVDR